MNENFDDLTFKPYYKWITFNTQASLQHKEVYSLSFKPYYKWITFNTVYSFHKLSYWGGSF